MKKTTTVLASTLILVAGISFGSTPKAEKAILKVKGEKVKIVNQLNEKEEGKVFKSSVPSQEQIFKAKDPSKGDSIGITCYQSQANNVLRKMVTVYKGNPYFAWTIKTPATSSKREVHFISKDANGNYVHEQAFNAGTAGESRWSCLDVARTGTAADLATFGVVCHYGSSASSNLNVRIDGAFQGTKQFDPSTDPSVALANDIVYLASTGDRTTYTFYKSADFGATFTQWGTINDFKSSIPRFEDATTGAGNQNTEVDLFKSANEKYVCYMSVNDGVRSGLVYDSVPADSATNIWTLTSSDNGATWKPDVIAKAGVAGLVSNIPDLNIKSGDVEFTHTLGSGKVDTIKAKADYTLSFAPFDPADPGKIGYITPKGAVTNDGVVHVVSDGLAKYTGYAVIPTVKYSDGTTATNVKVDMTGAEYRAPIVYWNSKDRKWLEVSTSKTSKLSNDNYLFGGPGTTGYQNQPSISVSEDGNVVFVVYRGADYINDTLYRTTNANLSTPSLGWYSALYYNTSFDGGKTWGTPATVPGTSGNKVAEFAVSTDQLLEKVSAGEYKVHMTYLADKDLATAYGTKIVPIKYQTLSFKTNAVEQNNGKINNFALAQNYPNPFNPSTVINFSVPSTMKASLKVYDVLGKEVATLVDGIVTVGNNNVSFNASKLSSGVYFYTLRAGNMTTTKKMLLTK